MPKNKSKAKPRQAKKQNKPKNVRKVARTQQLAVIRSKFDAAAAAYARLLTNPCRATLVHPTYPGASGGYLTRFSQYFIYNTGATDTTGFIHFTPGAISSDNTDFLVYSGAGTALAATAQGALLGGRSFLTGNASAVRCIAACVTVMYSGTEVDRSGRIHYGITNGSLVDGGQSVVPNDIMMAMEGVMRTPDEMIEINWRPNDWDANFVDPTAGMSPLHKDKASAVTVGWVGVKSAVPLTFKITAVYEWQPKIATGISMVTSSHSSSKSSLSDVLDMIDKAGKNPWVRMAGRAMAGVSGMMRGGGSMIGY